jgi:hypothetical protein
LQEQKKCGRNFLPSDFGDVLANFATTSRFMDKWMSRLDSAGQKDPEITLKGVLILVGSWYTTGKNRLVAFLRTPLNDQGKEMHFL